MPNDAITCEHFAAPRRSLRIAIVTETYPPEVNGVASTVARFVAGLRELNHDLQLIRPRQAGDALPRNAGDELLLRGLPLPNYPGLHLGLPAAAQLKRVWSRQRPDVVHVVTEGPLGWSAVQAASRLEIPLTSDFRTHFDLYSGYYGVGWLRKPIGAYLRKLHNRTLVTTAPTASLRRELTALGYRNVQVVARGVDTALFAPGRRSEALRASWGADAADAVLGYVGRLAPEKNLALLVAAFREVRRRQPRAKLVLVGDGPQRGALAGEPGAIFAGVRQGEDLAAHYASFDFFLFPSETETFGNVTVEAMASGLAIVACDRAAAAEHIENGVSGLLARCGDAGHYVEQALRLTGDAVLAARCRSEARRSAGTLDWPRVVQRLEAILSAASAAPSGIRCAPTVALAPRPRRHFAP